MTGTPPLSAASPLDGVRVVLLRGADRSGPMAAELRGQGAVVSLLPLIDFEEPADPAPVGEALRLLAAGAFAWLVITSITTVQALKQHAAGVGENFGGIVPPTTRIAAVGSATRRSLEAEGLRVDLVPGDGGLPDSAVGLLEAFRPPAAPAGARVLLPQTNIAPDALEQGLIQLGWNVFQVTAYHTVDYPAAADRRITAAPAAGPGGPGAAAEPIPELDLDGFLHAAAAGKIEALVFTSPSTVRRLHRGVDGLTAGVLPPGLLAVAIGASTAAEASRCGVNIAAVAAEPTPAGVAAAVVAALAAAVGETNRA